MVLKGPSYKPTADTVLYRIWCYNGNMNNSLSNNALCILLCSARLEKLLIPLIYKKEK